MVGSFRSAIAPAVLVLAFAGCQPSPPATSAAPAEDWSLTKADLPRLLQEQESNIRTQLQLGADEVPKVTMERMILPPEAGNVHTRCLHELGFTNVKTSQNGIEIVNPSRDQDKAIRVALYTCQLRFPIDPRATMTLPRKRAAMQFEHLKNVVAPCVQKEFGISSEPPSREVWLSQYYARETSGGAQPWDPFTPLINDKPSLDRAYVACPHDAPDLYPPLA